jgi:hypothetical protein
MSNQMDDYCDMMDVIDSNPLYLKLFSKIITKAIWEFINGGKLTSHIMELQRALFSNEKFIIDVLKHKKRIIDYVGIKSKLNAAGEAFSKLLIRGAIDEIKDQATSMNEYITDPKLKKQLDDMSIASGKEKFFGIMSASQLMK